MIRHAAVLIVLLLGVAAEDIMNDDVVTVGDETLGAEGEEARAMCLLTCRSRAYISENVMKRSGC